MTHTDPDLRQTAKALADVLARFADEYPTDPDGTGRVSLALSPAGDGPVGPPAVPLQPGQVEWLTQLVERELETARRAHDGGDGGCGHCGRTGPQDAADLWWLFGVWETTAARLPEIQVLYRVRPLAIVDGTMMLEADEQDRLTLQDPAVQARVVAAFDEEAGPGHSITALSFTRPGDGSRASTTATAPR